MFNVVDFRASIMRLTNIVRAYDIRGIVPDRLDENDAFVLGYILGKYFNKIAVDLSVIIGMDNRRTSFRLSNAMIAGFAACGLVVKQLGIVSTSALYYEAFVSDFDMNTLGVMVTASHNPAEYNGFKIVFNSKIVDGSAILNIIKEYNICSEKQPDNDYLNYLLNRSGLDNLGHVSNIRILWDCNNGATQQLIRELITKLPNHNTVIGCNTYIEDIPDPTHKRNIDRVKSMIDTYDMAFCFDGDGDRLLLVNNDKKVLRGDKILLILAEYYARNVGDHKSIVDIKTSNSVINHMKNLGFEIFIQKTGHSFIKQMMCQKQATIGGEVSGHIFFKFIEFDGNYVAYDDALLAACYLLKIMLSEPEFIRQIIDNISETICEYDLKVYCNRDIQQPLIASLKDDLINRELSFIDIDGVKYESDNGWWLVRQSNTEDALIICIEGKTRENFEQIRLYLQDKLSLYNLSLNINEP
jgi:phosphomannomutase